MLVFLQKIFEICQLRANPEDIHPSNRLKLLTILSYMGVGLVTANLDQTFGNAVLSMTVDTIMLLGLGYAGLWICSYTNRTTQTITALAGTGTIFGIIYLPLLSWMQSLPNDEPHYSGFLLLGLVAWNVAVIGHILRNALSIPLWAGVSISVLYLYTSFRVMSALFIAGT